MVKFWQCWKGKKTLGHNAPSWIFLYHLSIMYRSMCYDCRWQIGVHYGTLTNPDVRDACPDDKEFLEILADYVKSRFPGAGERPSIMESCIYSVRSFTMLQCNVTAWVGNNREWLRLERLKNKWCGHGVVETDGRWRESGGPSLES